MIFDTQITLRLLSYPIVNGQTAEKLERETTVWAARKSVNRAEYYQAAQAGKRTDAIFRMHSAEYGGEQQLVCGSDVFDVVRSYGQETAETELTFDPATLSFANDAEANRLISRPSRSPWHL